MFVEASAVAPASAVVPTQLSAAMACGYVLWLLQKAQSVPWVNQYTVKLNALLRLFASGAATLGVSVAWSSAQHQLIIGNLTLGVVSAGLWHWFTQYAATHGFEKILNVASTSNVPLIPPPAMQAAAAAEKAAPGV